MVGRRIGKIVSVIGTVLIVLAAVVIAGPRLLGWQLMEVLSGSMEPAYPVGSVVYVRSASPQEVKVGDPITFLLEDGKTVVTHRVVRIDTQKQCFYTKGDANNVEDGGATPYSRLIGKPVFDIPGLGYTASFLASPRGKIVFTTVLVCILILVFLPGLLMKKGEGASRVKGG
jgi:signal peptidase